MTGVTWNERQPGDWLASNGRWYPKSQHPRNWSTLALPPAPGHGGVSQLHSESSSRRTQANQSTRGPVTSGARSGNSTTSGTRDVGTAVVPTGRRVADATATKVTSYKYRIERGAEEPGALPEAPEGSDSPESAEAAPPPPGRLATTSEQATASAPPPPVLAPRPPNSRARTQPQTIAKVAGVGYGGDLGRVLGKARKRIEQAIEESAQAGNRRE